MAFSLSFEVFLSTNARCASASIERFHGFLNIAGERVLCCVVRSDVMDGMDVLPYLADIKFISLLINEAVDRLRSIAQFNV